MPSAPTGHALEIRRHIPAPPAAVYDAWTKPELLTRWFSPTVDHAVVVHLADLAVAGHVIVAGNRNASAFQHQPPPAVQQVRRHAIAARHH